MHDMMARMHLIRCVMMLGMVCAFVACDGGGNTTGSSGSPTASTSARVAPKANDVVKAAPTPSPSQPPEPAPSSSAAEAAPSASAAASSAVAPKDRGLVTVKALLEGWKKEPAAWLGSSVKIQGTVQSYTENTYTLERSGLQGPDKAGTYFGVHLTDPGAPFGAPAVGCFLEEGKSLQDVRAAFKKANPSTEEVAIEVSGPIEGSFGALAPCKIGKVSVVKVKK